MKFTLLWLAATSLLVGVSLLFEGAPALAATLGPPNGTWVYGTLTGNGGCNYSGNKIAYAADFGFYGGIAPTDFTAAQLSSSARGSFIMYLSIPIIYTIDSDSSHDYWYFGADAIVNFLGATYGRVNFTAISHNAGAADMTRTIPFQNYSQSYDPKSGVLQFKMEIDFPPNLPAQG